MTSRTVTAVLGARREQVFEYLSRVENLPKWATEFARELRYEDGKAKVVNGLGEFFFSIDADPATGVIDMYAGPSEGELARRALLSKQTMTTLVRRLERDGLVERRPDPDDARAALIFLTPRARAFEPVAAEALAELDREVAALVAPRERAALARALQRLLALGRPT